METQGERLRVWTLGDVVASIKYPLWTLWRFVVNFPLAVRNTRIILAAFGRTVYLGYRAIPVLRRVSGRYSDRARGRYIWRVARRFWAPWILERAEIHVDVVGKERIDWSRPYVVVSNHQSTLDIFPLIANIPWGRFVAKKEILAFPVIGAAARNGAQIIIDRSNHEQSMRAIREGMRAWPDCHLIFFAEGTRTRDGCLKPFKKGAFAIAKEAGLDIVPVAISGAFEALPKGSLLRLKRRPSIRVEFGAPLPFEGTVPEMTERTREVIKRMLEGSDLHRPLQTGR